MAIRYAFDLYPRLDPRDGAVIRRFEHLQEAAYKGEENGTGAGQFTIHGGSADAEDIDPLGLDYVRVIEIDDADAERVVGGFFLDGGDYEALTRKETRKLKLGGAGTLSYLQRAVMWSRSYINNAVGGFIGQDPIGETWNLANQSTFYANGNHLGAMLWRVITEAQQFRSGSYTHRHFDYDGTNHTGTHSDDRTESAIPDLVMTFDQFEDSDGNPWSETAGEFTAQVGESVLDVVRRLMEMGLKVEMDPDTFELRAWEAPHRTDRTSGTWAANKVRFQKPTAEDVATGNILSDTRRNVRAYIQRSVVLAGGQNSYAISQGSNEPPWEGGYRLDTSETTTPASVASRQRLARSDAVDNVKLTFKLGDDELNGYYRPWDHVSPGDLVTLHTGTDQWEYNDQTFPVAGLIVELKEGGDWRGIVELGSSFTSLLEPAFRASSPGAHSHPPNPQLCIAGFAVGGDAAVESTVAFGDSGSGYTVDWHPGTGATDKYLIVGITFKGSGWDSSRLINSVTWQPDYTMVGTHQSLSRIGRKVGSTMSQELWALSNPTDEVGSNGKLHVSPGQAGDRTSFVAAWLSGVESAPDVSAGSAGTGTSSSDASSSASGDLVLNWGGVAATTALTAALGLTELNEYQLVSATNRNSTALGSEVAAGAETSGWTFASNEWVSMSAVFSGSSFQENDGPLRLVGSASRASRCDHNHLVEYLLTDETDTDLRLAPDGAGGVEWAATTTITDHGALTGLADDDHPQYTTEAEVLALIDTAEPSLRWEAVTDGEDVFVWEGDDLVHEFRAY